MLAGIWKECVISTLVRIGVECESNITAGISVQHVTSTLVETRVRYVPESV